MGITYRAEAMIAHCQPQHSPVVGNIVVHRLDQRVDGNNESLFIAFLHGAFVGSAVAKIMDWNACSIRALFVSPKDRRMSVATRLLAEIEKWATAQGANQIECAVLKGNEPARQFWIRKGRFIDDSSREAEGEQSAEYTIMYREL